MFLFSLTRMWILWREETSWMGICPDGYLYPTLLVLFDGPSHNIHDIWQ
jgi:hypothetical protein